MKSNCLGTFGNIAPEIKTNKKPNQWVMVVVRREEGEDEVMHGFTAADLATNGAHILEGEYRRGACERKTRIDG